MSENHDQLMSAFFHVADRNERIAELEAEVERLRALIEEVEWFNSTLDDSYIEVCPWCDCEEAQGHASDCKRQAALEPEPKEESC